MIRQPLEAKICKLEVAIMDKDRAIDQLQAELDKATDALGDMAKLFAKTMEAVNAIWPIIAEDFPNGTGDDHGTCATDEYIKAAHQIESLAKGGK